MRASSASCFRFSAARSMPLMFFSHFSHIQFPMPMPAFHAFFSSLTALTARTTVPRNPEMRLLALVADFSTSPMARVPLRPVLERDSPSRSLLADVSFRDCPALVPASLMVPPICSPPEETSFRDFSKSVPALAAFFMPSVSSLASSAGVFVEEPEMARALFLVSSSAFCT